MSLPTAGARDASRLVRRHILDMEGYVPVRGLEELAQELGFPSDSLIKLDANENPYGCSPRVQLALASAQTYHIYPDTDMQQLREMLSSYVGVGAEHTILGAGSDELIDLLMRLFLEPADRVVICPPTFDMYRFSAQAHGGQVVSVLRREGYSVDSEAVLAVEDAKLIFIDSPNNPTGVLTSREDILRLLAADAVVVVDEAYYEFCGQTVAPWVPEYDNLIVLRTFSKWAGLGGLRVGYGIFPLGLVEHLWKVKTPYTVSAAAQIALRESLADLERLQDRVQAIIAERERLFQKLSSLGFLKPIPSQANFILCGTPQGQGLRIKEQLKQRGILVRYFDRPGLSDFLRISVGRPEHTDALIEALREIGAGYEQ